MQNPLSNLNDQLLMDKYQKGDELAFTCLYQRHNSKIYAYLTKRVHHQDEVEDLYQKVWIKLHKSKHLYDEKLSFLPWLYTITKSVFLDYLKKKPLKTTDFKEDIHGIDKTSQKELPFDINEQRLLTTKEKEVLIQRFYHDQDFKEISELLDTTESNIRKILSRGIKKLKKKFKGAQHE